ncbi:MAG TPA: LacI family DNA-binding transcriptional regulator [Gaiellaceae bacterium]|nr:LacI family DNA-binding transcriptional regulator [Gaiellaceae bacterium]
MAIASGVDVSTASRILNNDPNQSARPETRERVLEVARRLNYRRNAAALALRTTKTNALAILVPNLSNVAYAEVTEGARLRAADEGYVLFVVSGTPSELLSSLTGRIDGVMLAASRTDVRFGPEVGALMPTVLLNRHVASPINSIIIDDGAGIEALVEHLVELGHADIGHIAGPANTDTGARRLTAFKSALRARGLPVRASWIAVGEYSEEGGYDATLRVISARKRPTALIASTVATAIGVLAALRDNGIDVPGDISVASYDDVPLASFVSPPLTAVRMPLREMGARAVEVLLNLIDGLPVENEVLQAPPVLNQRASTAPPRA